jgi:hypothetical protein
MAAPLATLNRHGRVVVFSPGHRKVLSALATRRVTARGNFAAKVPVPIVGPGEGPDEWVTGVGLSPVVARLLESAGFEIVHQITETSPRALPPASQRQWTVTPIGQFLEFLRANFEGTLRFVTGRVDLAQLIAEAALAHPTAQIVVATDSRAAGGAIARRLARWLGRVPAFDCRPRSELQNEDLPRVCVSTFIGLAELDVEFGIDLLFIPNVAELTSRRADLAVSHAHHARVFGFAPIGQRLSRFEEDVLRSVLGFAELALIENGVPIRRVEIVRTQVRGAAVECREGADFLRPRVWRNPIRTRRVISLASLLQRRDRIRLGERFPEVATAFEGNFNAYCGLAIVCDNAEHALQIRRNIHQPCLLIGARESGQCLGSAESALSPINDRIHLITTRDALADGCVDLRALDVLLVPGENPHSVSLPYHSLASTDGSRLTIVEFYDREHPVLRRWARSRFDEYARRGIFTPNVDPVRARVDEFIKSHRSGEST